MFNPSKFLEANAGYTLSEYDRSIRELRDVLVRPGTYPENTHTLHGYSSIIQEKAFHQICTSRRIDRQNIATLKSCLRIDAYVDASLPGLTEYSRPALAYLAIAMIALGDLSAAQRVSSIARPPYTDGHKATCFIAASVHARLHGVKHSLAAPEERNMYFNLLVRAFHDANSSEDTVAKLFKAFSTCKQLLPWHGGNYSLVPILPHGLVKLLGLDPASVPAAECIPGLELDSSAISPEVIDVGPWSRDIHSFFRAA